MLLQRAAGHLVKVIMRADDSDGMIGDLARRVLELHRQACAAGVADPQKLARWMVRFSFEDQDFFEIDPVTYTDALGAKGLAVYRREVKKRSDPASAPTDGIHPGSGTCTGSTPASQPNTRRNAPRYEPGMSIESSSCSVGICPRRTSSCGLPRR